MEIINTEPPTAGQERKKPSPKHLKGRIGPEDPDHFSNYVKDPKTGEYNPDISIYDVLAKEDKK
jgi:hypothetical protein